MIVSMRRSLAALGLTLAVAAATLGATSLSASADEVLPDPLPGTNPIAVSLGDSYISGESGRWAGNALTSRLGLSKDSDVGPQQYWDTPTGESIPGCHRSKKAEIHFGTMAGTDLTTVNLACSGATTATHWDVSGSTTLFKPGIDFYRWEKDAGTVYRGQALELYRLAKANNTVANPTRVRMVVLSIGGNDFHFADIVKQCVLDFPVPGRNCSNRPEIREEISDRVAAMRLQAVRRAVLNIGEAMADAGYAPGDWTLVVQDYPSPIPGDPALFRYSGLDRLAKGGCPFSDKDAAWANEKALGVINRTVFAAALQAGLTNVRYLDLSSALVDRRLCEKGQSLVGYDLVGNPYEVTHWTNANAPDKSEWVAQIRLESMLFDVYQMSESLHPDYWAQLAYQACLKWIWNGGAVRDGACVRNGNGLVDGRPDMVLMPGWSPAFPPLLNGNPDGFAYPDPLDPPDPDVTPTVTVTQHIPGAAVTVTAAVPGPTVTATRPGATVTTTATVPASLPVVTGLTVASPARGRVVAAWQPADGAWGYEYRLSKATGWTPWSSTRSRSVTLTGKPSGPAVFQVRAVTTVGSGLPVQASVVVR